ncbi:MAG: hypothetical protein HUJ26_12130 [Planctomycetaceae bacterium]|nr:hypothetical protein [Planctomycetaceae bacterium]
MTKETVTEYTGGFSNSGSSSVSVDFDVTGGWNGTTYTLTGHTNSHQSHSQSASDTMTLRTIQYQKSSSNATDIDMSISLSGGETFSVSTHTSNSSILGAPMGGPVEFYQSIDFQGQPSGSVSLGGTYKITDVSNYETENTSSWEDSHFKDRTTTETLVSGSNTTVTSTYEVLIDKYQGVYNDPSSFTSSYDYPTDPQQLNGVPYSFTSMPGLFDPFNSLRLALMGQIASEMGSTAADDDMALAGQGSGNAAGAESSSSGVYYDTGPLDDGGYWESYDDGSYWWYAEYDAAGNEIYYEDSDHMTFDMGSALAMGESIGQEGNDTGAPNPDAQQTGTFMASISDDEATAKANALKSQDFNPNDPPQELADSDDKIVYWVREDGTTLVYYNNGWSGLEYVGKLVRGTGGQWMVERYVPGKGNRYMKLSQIEKEANYLGLIPFVSTTPNTTEEYEEQFSKFGWTTPTPRHIGALGKRAAELGQQKLSPASSLVPGLVFIAEATDGIAMVLVEEGMMSVIPWGSGAKVFAKGGKLFTKFVTSSGKTVLVELSEKQLKQVGTALNMVDGSADDIAEQIAKLQDEAAEGSAEALAKLKSISTNGVETVLEPTGRSWRQHGSRLYGDLKNKFGLEIPFKAKSENVKSLVAKEYQKLIKNGTLNYLGYADDVHGSYHFYEFGGNLYLFTKDGKLVSRWSPGSQGRAIERVLELLNNGTN